MCPSDWKSRQSSAYLLLALPVHRDVLPSVSPLLLEDVPRRDFPASLSEPGSLNHKSVENCEGGLTGRSFQSLKEWLARWESLEPDGHHSAAGFTPPAGEVLAADQLLRLSGTLTSPVETGSSAG